MFNPLIWLDSKLLGAAQKFCDKVQRTTGMTKFALERMLLVTILCLFLIGDTNLSVATSTSMTLWLDALMIVGVSILLLFSVFEEKSFFKTGVLLLRSSHTRAGRIFWTVLFVSLSILAFSLLVERDEKIPLDLRLAGYVYVIVAACIVAHEYISACIPRPPSKSKMREWCEKALIALNESLKPAPALVPITIPSR